MRAILTLVLASNLLSPLCAQAPKDPAAQVVGLEEAAKGDAEALFKAATFAREHGLLTEWRRLLNRVIVAAPEHEAAHKALGDIKYDGRWMAPAKAEILRQRAAGKELVGGLWVPSGEADDARNGVFRFGGQVVTKDEYSALSSGKVRHPRTGELIDAGDAEKAKNNLFLGGQGKWIDEAEANKQHARADNPWVVRTKSCTVISTMPLKEIEQQAGQYVDDAHDFALSLIGQHLRPAQRPVVMMVGTADRYRDVGNQIGGPSSAYGAFLAEGSLQVAGLGVVRPAVMLVDQNWGTYYLKHAVGLAVADSYTSGLPGWFVAGVGVYTERFYSRDIVAWFGQQYLAAGGVTDLKGWFGRFGINADMDHAAMGRQLFQAGLLLAYAQHARDADAKAQLDAVCQAVAQGDTKAIAVTVAAFEQGLEAKVDAVRAYLKSLTQG